MRRLMNRRGQSTAEYAIVIGLVVAAVIAMQTYVKRGLQGRVKDAVDHVSAAGEVGGATLTFSGNQYEPGYLGSTFTTQRAAGETTAVTLGGGVTRTVTQDDIVSRTGSQTIDYEEEEEEE